MGDITKLNLSYCDGVPPDFVNKLFDELWTQSSSCREIQMYSHFNLYGKSVCEPDLFLGILSNIKNLASEKGLRSLELSVHDIKLQNNSAIQQIERTWKNIFGNSSVIERNGKKCKLRA